VANDIVQIACWDYGFESHWWTWMFACCVLSGRGLCERLITVIYDFFRVVVMSFDHHLPFNVLFVLVED
jgi:hypothetical protein